MHSFSTNSVWDYQNLGIFVVSQTQQERLEDIMLTVRPRSEDGVELKSNREPKITTMICELSKQVEY